MIPKPGSTRYEEMIEFMRADINSGMALTKMVQSVKERFKEEGRDFDEEFKNWKKENNL